MNPLAVLLNQPTCGGRLLNAVTSYLDADAGHAEEAEALWCTLHGVGLSLGVGEWLASFRERVLEGTRSGASYQTQERQSSSLSTEEQVLVPKQAPAAYVYEIEKEMGGMVVTVVEEDKVAEALEATACVEGASGRDHRVVDSRAEAVVAEIVRKLGGENIENNEVVENLGNCLVPQANMLTL
jgi:hypothetical protein